jgi:hypothetical protein
VEGHLTQDDGYGDENAVNEAFAAKISFVLIPDKKRLVKSRIILDLTLAFYTDNRNNMTFGKFLLNIFVNLCFDVHPSKHNHNKSPLGPFCENSKFLQWWRSFFSYNKTYL